MMTKLETLREHIRQLSQTVDAMDERDVAHFVIVGVVLNEDFKTVEFVEIDAATDAFRAALQFTNDAIGEFVAEELAMADDADRKTTLKSIAAECGWLDEVELATLQGKRFDA